MSKQKIYTDENFVKCRKLYAARKLNHSRLFLYLQVRTYVVKHERLMVVMGTIKTKNLSAEGN